MRPGDAQIQQSLLFFFADFDDLIANNHLIRCSIVFALLMTGCASNVSVDAPTIPAPHIDKLPIDVALRIPAEFHNFVHEESVLGRESWIISLGSANATFFEQLFGYMFDNVIILGPDDDALEYTFDALIEPKSKDSNFQFRIRARPTHLPSGFDTACRSLTAQAIALPAGQSAPTAKVRKKAWVAPSRCNVLPFLPCATRQL